jgi:hypothetical protein
MGAGFSFDQDGRRSAMRAGNWEWLWKSGKKPVFSF